MSNIHGFHMTFPNGTGIFFSSKERFLEHLEQVIDKSEQRGTIKYFGIRVGIVEHETK